MTPKGKAETTVLLSTSLLILVVAYGNPLLGLLGLILWIFAQATGLHHLWQAGYRDGYGTGRKWIGICYGCALSLPVSAKEGEMPRCDKCWVWEDGQKKK